MTHNPQYVEMTVASTHSPYVSGEGGGKSCVGGYSFQTESIALIVSPDQDSSTVRLTFSEAQEVGLVLIVL